MANHCFNYVVFRGAEEQLNQLVDNLNTVREQFIKEHRELHGEQVWIYGQNGHIVLGNPAPKTDEEGIYKVDVYTEYGSKWFDCEFTKDYVDNKLVSVSLQGDSAWSPMLPLFLKITKNFELEAFGSYEEPGLDFAGEFEFIKGEIVFHDEMSYSAYQAKYNPESYWENLIDNIQEGMYSSVEDIYISLDEDGWGTTEGEKVTIKELFDKSNKNVN